MYDAVVKYDLWIALNMCPEKYKTDDIRELEKKLNDSMSKGYYVYVDDKKE